MEPLVLNQVGPNNAGNPCAILQVSYRFMGLAGAYTCSISSGTYSIKRGAILLTHSGLTIE